MPHQLDDELLQYSVQNSTKEDAILSALRKRTWQKVLTPQMLSDPIQGKFLQNLSRMVRPKRILELGTYTGYSTICLASGLSADGVIDTVEPNDELNSIQEEFWQKAGIIERVNRFNAEALEVLPNLSGLYDIIWIDADKPRTRIVCRCLPSSVATRWLVARGQCFVVGQSPSKPCRNRCHGRNHEIDSFMVGWSKRRPHDLTPYPRWDFDGRKTRRYGINEALKLFTCSRLRRQLLQPPSRE